MDSMVEKIQMLDHSSDAGEQDNVEFVCDYNSVYLSVLGRSYLVHKDGELNQGCNFMSQKLAQYLILPFPSAPSFAPSSGLPVLIVHQLQHGFSVS